MSDLNVTLEEKKLEVTISKTGPAGSDATVTEDAVKEVYDDVEATLTNKTLTALSNTIYADQLHVEARNISGVDLDKGRLVYISGFNVGQDLFEVDLADQSDDAKMSALGMVFSSIANNDDGTVVQSGRITDIDTSAYSVGDVLYVGTNGDFTATKPTTGLIQKVGTVTRANANNGSIDVHVQAEALKITPTVDGDATSKKYVDGSDRFTSVGSLSAEDTITAFRDSDGVAVKISSENYIKDVITSELEWGLVRYSDFGFYTQTSGSGLIQSDYRRLLVYSGATASSTAGTRTRNDGGFFAGFNSRGIDYGSYFVLRYLISQRGNHTTNGESWAGFGKINYSGDALGDLTARGVAFKLIANRLYLQVHNGTTLTNIDSEINIVGNDTYSVSIENIGDGNVNLYVNGVLQATTDQGSTVTTDNRSSFYFETNNNTDSAIQALIMHSLKFITR